MSKLRVGEWVKTIYRPEWKGLEPNHFYRALSFFAEHKGRLEEALRTRCAVFSTRINLAPTQTEPPGKAVSGGLH
jgi:hypothetical protein